MSASSISLLWLSCSSSTCALICSRIKYRPRAGPISGRSNTSLNRPIRIILPTHAQVHKMIRGYWSGRAEDQASSRSRREVVHLAIKFRQPGLLHQKSGIEDHHIGEQPVELYVNGKWHKLVQYRLNLPIAFRGYDLAGLLSQFNPLIDCRARNGLTQRAYPVMLGNNFLEKSLLVPEYLQIELDTVLDRFKLLVQLVK